MGLVCTMISNTVLTSTGFAVHSVVAHVIAHLPKSSSADMCHVVGVVALGVGLLRSHIQAYIYTQIDTHRYT